MRVIDIVAGTTVDGPGLRTSIYFAGCTHACPGCHNPQTHSPEVGRDMTIAEIVEIVEREGFDVTFSGGDPLYQVDQLTQLARELRGRGYGIWCYTGYTYEQVLASEHLSQILPHIDALVDGPYVESLRTVSLPFRGSSNQRIIELTRDHAGLCSN